MTLNCEQLVSDDDDLGDFLTTNNVDWLDKPIGEWDLEPLKGKPICTAPKHPRYGWGKYMQGWDDCN
jgi:hypothetical protein